ncbi:hypothetical protein CsSME_00053539 [Camellia sinensis var. sinensis]
MKYNERILRCIFPNSMRLKFREHKSPSPIFSNGRYPQYYFLMSKVSQPYTHISQRNLSIHAFLIACAFFTGVGLLNLTLRSVNPSTGKEFPIQKTRQGAEGAHVSLAAKTQVSRTKRCVMVEEIGEIFSRGFWKESLQVKRKFDLHFALNDQEISHYDTLDIL